MYREFTYILLFLVDCIDLLVQFANLFYRICVLLLNLPHFLTNIMNAVCNFVVFSRPVIYILTQLKYLLLFEFDFSHKV